MDGALSSNKFKEFRCDACDAICIKLIRSKADFEGGSEFHPEFCHQLFGENEQIFGYSNLKINIWYLAGSLSTYIGTTYSSVIDPKVSNVQPDDIYNILSESYPYQYDRNLVDFTQTFNEDKFRPFGTVRHSYERTSGKTQKFRIYYMEHGMENFDDFVSYHQKMESFLLFFVDGASAIPTSDTQWCYYSLFEVITQTDSSETYAFIGYMTVYKFYAYPSNLRPRLSQILILPPYRNNGHATELLHTFYRDFLHVPNVRDITVEDPSDDFRRIRDFVDCKRCLEHPGILKLLKKTTSTNETIVSDKDKYKLFRNKLQEELKINRCQAKRVFEILQLYLLPRNSDAFNLFREALQKRTVLNYERARSDAMCGRITDRRHGSTSESEPARKMIDEIADECFRTQIKEQVELDMDAYQTIVDKLDRHVGARA